MRETPFNAEYYRRYYENRSTAVVTPAAASAEIAFVRSDVLRYLPNRNAKTAITRLAFKCRGAFYLHVVTSDDEVDEAASDMTGYFRSARWYQRELKSAGFRNAGMGLFVSPRFREFDPFALEVPR